MLAGYTFGKWKLMFRVSLERELAELAVPVIIFSLYFNYFFADVSTQQPSSGKHKADSYV